MGFSKGLPSNATCEQSSLERREKLQVVGCEIGRGRVKCCVWWLLLVGICLLFCVWVFWSNFHPAARKFTVTALQSNFEKNSARWCPDDNAVRKDEDNGPHPVMEFMLITMVIARQRGGLLLPRSTVTKVPPWLKPYLWVMNMSWYSPATHRVFMYFTEV